jgi:hypothetical protein
LARVRSTQGRIAAARKRFETTSDSFASIAREVGVPRSTLDRQRLRQGWTRPVASSEENKSGSPICPGIGLCPIRQNAHRRLYDALLSRIRGAEAREPAAAAVDRERDMRMLAAMVRTLERLTAMDRDIVAAMEPARQDERDRSDDVEALRRDLAQRLERLLGAGAGESAPGRPVAP